MAAIAAEAEPPPGAELLLPNANMNCRKLEDANGPSLCVPTMYLKWLEKQGKCVVVPAKGI